MVRMSPATPLLLLELVCPLLLLELVWLGKLNHAEDLLRYFLV
jgi:hypothetical protein